MLVTTTLLDCASVGPMFAVVVLCASRLPPLSVEGIAPTIAAGNRIVEENKFRGNPRTEWDVNGAGNPDVEGFSTRASLLPGAIIKFKVKMRYAEPLRVDIYRLGWYGGDGARLQGRADIINLEAASKQPECANTEPEGAEPLWDCGNWAVVAIARIPENATSGVYIARAVLPNRDPTNNWI